MGRGGGNKRSPVLPFLTRLTFDSASKFKLIGSLFFPFLNLQSPKNNATQTNSIERNQVGSKTHQALPALL